MKFTHVSLALLALSLAQGAQAQVSATASIDWSSLTVTLIDMSGTADPTDNPVFNWLNQSTTLNASSVSPGAAIDVAYPPSITMPDWTTQNSVVATTTYAQGAASVTPNNSLLAMSSAQPSVMPIGGGYNIGYASAARSAAFSLTGIGQAVIQVNWSLGVNDPTPLDAQDWAVAAVSFQGDYALTGCCGTPITTTDAAVLDSSIYNVPSASGSFYMAVMNPSLATTADGALQFVDTTSWAYGYVNPVPEPETWAMMIAGLGLVGLWGRRRSA